MVVCGGYEEQNHCQIRFIVDEAIVEGSAFSNFFVLGSMLSVSQRPLWSVFLLDPLKINANKPA